MIKLTFFFLTYASLWYCWKNIGNNVKTMLRFYKAFSVIGSPKFWKDSLTKYVPVFLYAALETKLLNRFPLSSQKIYQLGPYRYGQTPAYIGRVASEAAGRTLVEEREAVGRGDVRYPCVFLISLFTTENVYFTIPSLRSEWESLW